MSARSAPDESTYHRVLNEIAADGDLDHHIAAAVTELGLEQCALPIDGGYAGQEFRDAVVLAIATLRLIARYKSTGASDYWWKHQAESLSGRFGESQYVPRGAMITAARIENVQIFEFQLVRQPNGEHYPRCSLRAGPIAAWRKA